jgi:hypothetical protein
MKKVIKVLALVAAVIMIGSAVTSCKSTECPAYGEVEKYQQEVRR